MPAELVPVWTQELWTFCCTPETPTPNYPSQVQKGEPSRILFHQCDCSSPCPNCLQNVYVVFNWRVCSGYQRQGIFHLHHIHMVGKKVTLSMEHIVFRSMSHKILPDKSFTMSYLARNTSVCFLFSTNNMHPMQCRHFSLPLPFLRRSVCSDSSSDAPVLQTPEILKFVFYNTSSYLQALITKQVSD